MNGTVVPAFAPFRYHLLAFRRDQLWLPCGLWLILAVIVAISRGSSMAYDAGRSFLGMILPLAAGLLSASAMTDDPAIELHLAAPRRPARTLLERQAILLAITASAALTFQLYLAAMGVDMGTLGGLLARQLVWLIPTVALMALASAIALGAAASLPGTLVTGLIWLASLFGSDWWAGTVPVRYIYLFMGAARPASPYLLANQLCLLGLTVVLLAIACRLLRHEERYL